MAPKLSICIPTYNRADYLDRALRRLFEERPVACDFEVVVSDNGSTDRTPEVIKAWSQREPSIRAWRQATNLGAARNWQCVIRLARGDYVVYLADDDSLIPGRIDPILRRMDERPDVAAVHAPWEIWDEVSGRQHPALYSLAAERTFNRTNALELLNFVVLDHIFPEIAIYRTAALQRMALIPFKTYWAFTHLVDLLDHGAVCFTTEPFYRFMAVSAGVEPRRSAGWDEVVHNRDSYQAGLEYLAARCFDLAGEREVLEPDTIRRMVENFMDVRLTVAARVVQQNYNWRGTYEMIARMRARGMVVRSHGERVDQELDLGRRAAVQSLVEAFEALSGLEAIAVAGFADPADAIGRIGEQRPDIPVKRLGDDPGEGVKDPERIMVFAGPRIDRPALLAAGYLNGLILCEADLLNQFRP